MFWRRNRDEAPAEIDREEAAVEPDLDAPEPDAADFGADSVVAEPQRSEPEPEPEREPEPKRVESDPAPEVLSPLARAAAFKPLFADTDEEIEEAFEHGLERTRGGFMTRLRGALAGGPDGPSWDDVEETLIAGDVGASLAMDVVERARRRRDPDGAEAAVRAELASLLVPREAHWEPKPAAAGSPAVMLIVGVNGTGKTTTIGKLATRYTAEGRTVLLAAADTFRAAAIDQLLIWADRAGVQVVSHAPGADPGAVVYDALDAAVARGADIVIADTAGRLHTKSNLMDELAKIRRIVDKRLPGAQPETLFVLDATTGQNGLQQAKRVPRGGRADRRRADEARLDGEGRDRLRDRARPGRPGAVRRGGGAGRRSPAVRPRGVRRRALRLRGEARGGLVPRSGIAARDPCATLRPPRCVRTRAPPERCRLRVATFGPSPRRSPDPNRVRQPQRTPPQDPLGPDRPRPRQRGGRGRGDARDPPLAARGGRQLQGRQGLHRPRPREGGGSGHPAVPHAPASRS